MKFPQSLQIPESGPVHGTIRVPGSKSLTNRAILIGAFAKGISRLKGVLHSDDTKYMMNAWEHLGVTFRNEGTSLEIEGCDGTPGPWSKPLYIGNSGTTSRFLTAALTLGKGKYLVTGNERMKNRPIGDLMDALNGLGAQVSDLSGNKCPPVQIVAEGLKGGRVRIPGDKSSQYISALMMAAPYAELKTEIEIVGNMVSRTYVEMTQHIMSDFGACVEWINPQLLVIHPHQHFLAMDYEIEGDASSASYFMGMAAITGGTVKIHGIRETSTQGDIGLLQVLESMGCIVHWEKDGVLIEGRPMKAIEVDMNTMSDVAPTLAVIALFARGETRILNVGNMRIKECDRIKATVTELSKLGAQTKEWSDGLSIKGMGDYRPAMLNTYDDHRMAMSLSLAGLKIPGVIIQNPQCVTKTFPDFFDQFLPLIKRVS